MQAMQATITFLFLVRFSKFKHHFVGNFLNFLNKKYKGTLGRPLKLGRSGMGKQTYIFLGLGQNVAGATTTHEMQRPALPLSMLALSPIKTLNFSIILHHKLLFKQQTCKPCPRERSCEN